MLNTREFTQVSKQIIDSLYRLNSAVKTLYDIHINYINDSWVIDFIPKLNNIPVIKVNTYTVQDDYGREILRITPKTLSDIQKELRLPKDKDSSDLYENYINIFRFILSLYDYEYKLH